MVTGAGLTPHRDSARFSRAMRRLIEHRRTISWRGDVYRMAHPKYADLEHFASGEGARLNGARWTPPDGAPTLYAATSPVLAAEETFALSRRLGFPPRKLLPRIIRAIEVRVSHLVDLTDGETRLSLGVSKGRIVQTDWREENAQGREALTQAIGRAAAEAGLEGLLVPSAVAPDEPNLVIFLENLHPASGVEPLG